MEHMKHMKRKKDLELLNKALNLHYVDWIECYKLADMEELKEMMKDNVNTYHRINA